MRVSTGVVRRRRHNKIKALAKGYRQAHRTTFKKTNEAVMKAGQNAYRDRRKKKRDFRALWIIRLNAAVRAEGINYSTFIANLTKKKITVNRKALSELAIQYPESFKALVAKVK
jgi:large subunit ribosomal protein L20